MKITFVKPDFGAMATSDDIFPFGYAIMGKLLQTVGHEVEYIFPKIKGWDENDVANYIVNKSKPDLLAIGGIHSYLNVIASFIKSFKVYSAGIPVVIGGQMVTYTPELAMKLTGADFRIIGEGERGMLDLVRDLESSVPPTSGSYDRGIIPIEEIPMPNWDDFPMDYYLYQDWLLPTWTRRQKPKVFTWFLSRGCPMKCNFCASGVKPRYKSIEQSISELRDIVDKFDPDYIMFIDNLFAPNEKRATDLCEAFIKEGFRFKWCATMRLIETSPEILDLMRKAGCEIIFYGLECANPKILKFMKKGITPDVALETIQKCKDAGLHPMVSIMHGQPNETLADFFESTKISLKATPNVASVMQLLTYPGAGIYDHAKSIGKFKDDFDYWERYGKDGKFLIKYTDVPDEEITTCRRIVEKLHRWKYHSEMTAKSLEELKGLSKGSESQKFLDRCLTEIVEEPEKSEIYWESRDWRFVVNKNVVFKLSKRRLPLEDIDEMRNIIHSLPRYAYGYYVRYEGVSNVDGIAIIKMEHIRGFPLLSDVNIIKADDRTQILRQYMEFIIGCQQSGVFPADLATSNTFLTTHRSINTIKIFDLETSFGVASREPWQEFYAKFCFAFLVYHFTERKDFSRRNERFRDNEFCELLNIPHRNHKNYNHPVWETLEWKGAHTKISNWIIPYLKNANIFASQPLDELKEILND